MASSPRPWQAGLVIAVAVCVSLVSGPQAGAAEDAAPAEKRLALVVGSSAYHPRPLPTAANDAGLVAQALAQDGFEVTALANPDHATLRRTAEIFAEEVRRAGDKALVFVYLSGVGVQYGGRNYVVPAPAAIERQADIPEKAVPFSDLLRILEAAPARARLFVFDLARPTPLATWEPIPLAVGLRHMQPSNGSLYAFNAAPGMVAPADPPLYGTYARAWVEALRTPGLKLHAFFSRVRLRVAEISGGAVVPWDNGELDPDLTLVPVTGKGGAEVANRPLSGQPVQTVFWAALAEDTLAGYQAFLNAFPTDPLAARVRLMKAVRLEAANWAEACRANTAAAYWTYMRRYPRGPHYVDVRRRLAAIQAAFAPPMRFEVTELGGLPSPSADELRAVDRPDSPFADAQLPAIPPPPDGLLPDPPPEVFVDLAPPPLPLRGTLPVGFPIAAAPAAGRPGHIIQPSDIGRLAIETGAVGGGAPIMTLASDKGTLSRTSATTEGHARSIVQDDGANKTLSRTTLKRTGDTLTISQTGPEENPLLKVVTRFSLKGDRDIIVSDGAGRRVAETHVDKRGVIKSLAWGQGSIDAVGFPPAVPSNEPKRQSESAPKAEARPPPSSSATPPAAAPEDTRHGGSISSAASPTPSKPQSPVPLPPKNALRITPAEPGLRPEAPVSKGVTPPEAAPPP